MTYFKRFIRANGPYQLMEFHDHHFPNDIISFPWQREVLQYLNSYADSFDLKKFIKFNHLVVRVLPIENHKWEMIVKDLSNDEFDTKIYDVVLVCTGHFSAPRIPRVDGINEFRGKIVPSRDYRTPEPFRGEFEHHF